MTDYTRQPDREAAQAASLTAGRDPRSIEFNRISWGAVLAGAVVALVVQLLLNLLGLGIGVGTLDPGTGDNPSAGAFSVAAGLWYLVAGIIAAYAGGAIAGRLSGGPVGPTSALHGFISWAVTTLVVFFLLTTAVGGIIGGVLSGVGGAVSGVGRSAVSAAQIAAPGLANATDPFGTIERQLREASGSDSAALRDAAVAAVRAALTGDANQAQEARDRASQALARAQNVSPAEAQKRIAQYEQQYQQTLDQAKQQAVQAAQTTAKVVSRGALFGFFALLLGAIAAWIGGGRSRTLVRPLPRAGLSPAPRAHS